MNIHLLESAINAYLNVQPNQDVIPVGTKEKMAKSFADFIERSTAKFIKGQVEHGGRLETRDLDKDMEQELSDFFWYHEAKKWRK